MDVRDQLNQLAATVRAAKTMPMSASCLLNRADTLDLLERLRDELPANLDHADALLHDRDAIMGAGREQAEGILEGARLEREQLIDQAEGILEDARSEREQLIEQTDVLVAARALAATVVMEAQAESTRLLADADGYVDRKLAEFELHLGQLQSQVNNGRQRLVARRENELAQTPPHRPLDPVDPAFGLTPSTPVI